MVKSLCVSCEAWQWCNEDNEDRELGEDCRHLAFDVSVSYREGLFYTDKKSLGIVII